MTSPDSISWTAWSQFHACSLEMSWRFCNPRTRVAFDRWFPDSPSANHRTEIVVLHATHIEPIGNTGDCEIHPFLDDFPWSLWNLVISLGFRVWNQRPPISHHWDPASTQTNPSHIGGIEYERRMRISFPLPITISIQHCCTSFRSVRKWVAPHMFKSIYSEWSWFIHRIYQ